MNFFTKPEFIFLFIWMDGYLEPCIRLNMLDKLMTIFMAWPIVKCMVSLKGHEFFANECSFLGERKNIAKAFKNNNNKFFASHVFSIIMYL